MPESPLVSIVMGSDSDLEIMNEAAKTLDDFAISYEIDVTSAHRSPARTAEFARTAASRGVKVIIAGAGGAAHLAPLGCVHRLELRGRGRRRARGPGRAPAKRRGRRLPRGRGVGGRDRVGRGLRPGAGGATPAAP